MLWTESNSRDNAKCRCDSAPRTGLNRSSPLRIMTECAETIIVVAQNSDKNLTPDPKGVSSAYLILFRTWNTGYRMFPHLNYWPVVMRAHSVNGKHDSHVNDSVNN